MTFLQKQLVYLIQVLIKAEKFFKLNNLYDIENVAITHFLDNALRANYIMTYDVDYLLNEDQKS